MTAKSVTPLNPKLPLGAAVASTLLLPALCLAHMNGALSMEAWITGSLLLVIVAIAAVAMAYRQTEEAGARHRRQLADTEASLQAVAGVMAAYSRANIVAGDARAFCIRDIYWNALRRRRQIETPDRRGHRYLPYPDPRSAEFLDLDIARIARLRAADDSGN